MRYGFAGEPGHSRWRELCFEVCELAPDSTDAHVKITSLPLHASSAKLERPSPAEACVEQLVLVLLLTLLAGSPQ